MRASLEVGTIQESNSLITGSQPVGDANKVITRNLEGPYLSMFWTYGDIVAPVDKVSSKTNTRLPLSNSEAFQLYIYCLEKLSF